MRNLLLVFTLLFLGICFTTESKAQDLLTDERTYTLKDTLRGTLVPDRDWFDVTFYNLNLTIDPDKQYLEGYNEISFDITKAIQPIMQIDLFENMKVEEIRMGKKKLKFKRVFDAIQIQMPKEKIIRSKKKIKVKYSGKPVVAEKPPWDGGFVWSKDENNKDWIGVACEGMGASAWWPNKDHLSDEPDSMMLSVAVPNDIQFIGNGKAVGTEKEGDFTRYNWFISYPINNYNVTVNAGDYVHIHDEYTNKDGRVLDLDYYVLPYNKEKAEKHFGRDVPRMMDCFGEYLGDYPFWEDGFALVETPYLGMEHQGAIAYGNEYKDGYAGNTRYTGGHEFDYIVIHETGHEWWGNSVSCKDIADLWIHEGFCTYSESIFVECEAGTEAAIKYINDKKPWIGNKESIIGDYGVNKEGSGDMYNKGSLFLNTLRHVVNDDELWWSIIKGLAEDFKYQTVDTQDIIDYMNEKTGKKLELLFDQYLRFPTITVFEYKLTKNEKGQVNLKYKWNSDVKGFDLPMRYQNAKGKWTEIQPSSKWQTEIIEGATDLKVTLAENQFYVDFKKVD